MSRLVVVTGVEVGKEFALPESGEFKVGRLPGIGITLDDAKVSREHCRLHLQSTGWVVEDLGSRNGTFVNKQPVKKRLLENKDRLRIGKTEFEYLTGAAAPAPSGTPALKPGRSARDRV